MPPDDTPAALLAAECCVRLCAALHASGEYFHTRHPRTGRVCCWRRGAEVPEGHEATEAQDRLWVDLEDGREGRET